MQHCAGFISAVTLDVSGASAHHQGYLKLVQRPLVHVLVDFLLFICAQIM
jgi:hypothetical protein